ncbi:hypothetical protein [Roseicyclus sp.]|uniref:hypothetical protein n=1 Tax=Roseicyclus sp. TaxID=1914329 RepID=UPI003F6BB894
MPTVTVLAPDSALAMDEVIRQLGDNAYILATHARDGQVEILATNEPTQIQPPRKRTTSVSFSDALFEQGVTSHASSPLFKSARKTPETSQEGETGPGQTDGAQIVDMQTARARLSEAMPFAPADWEKPELPAQSVEVFGTRSPASDTVATWSQQILPISAQAQATPPAISDPEISRRAPTQTPHLEAHPPQPPQPEPTRAPLLSPSPFGQGEADLRPILQELGAKLASLEASLAPQTRRDHGKNDPIVEAGFSTEIVKRLAPEAAAPSRATQFAASMSETLIAPDPMASLRATVVVIVGPSGAGKTILAGKIAALAVEIHPSCTVELVSLSETPRFANTALPIYARMLSVPHRDLQCDQLDAGQWPTENCTHIIDTNIETETMQPMLHALRAAFGHDGVSVIIALPLGSSLGRIKTELGKYRDFNPSIALTKLDECELTPQEASQIAEAGAQIAWLSGTRALTETIAPASHEMMNEFLTGLLTTQS